MNFEQPDFNDSSPLSLQITEIIQRKITGKEISVGQKLPSQRELRKIFNVSINTVGEAISNLIKTGYLSSRSKYGTFVINHQPEGKVDLQRKKEICLVVCKGTVNRNFEEVSFYRFISCIETKIKEKGLHLLYKTLAPDDDELDFEGKQADIAGLIVAGNTNLSQLRSVKRTRIPFVLIGDVLKTTKTDEKEENADIISSDDFQYTYLAARHLVSLGHKRIAFFTTGVRGYPVRVDMFEGYKKALSEANIVLDKNLIVEYGAREYEAVIEFLDNKIPFTSAICVFRCEFVIKAFKDKNIEVPNDMVAVSNNYLSKMTSVYYDSENIGRVAVDKLIERLTSPQWKPRRIVVPVKLSVVATPQLINV